MCGWMPQYYCYFNLLFRMSCLRARACVCVCLCAVVWHGQRAQRLPRESMMFINYQIGHHRATVVVRLMPILFEICALYICLMQSICSFHSFQMNWVRFASLLVFSCFYFCLFFFSSCFSHSLALCLDILCCCLGKRITCAVTYRYIGPIQHISSTTC